jgi:hypothetical protein
LNTALRNHALDHGASQPRMNALITIVSFLVTVGILRGREAPSTHD